MPEACTRMSTSSGAGARSSFVTISQAPFGAGMLTVMRSARRQSMDHARKAESGLTGFVRLGEVRGGGHFVKIKKR